MIVYGEKGTALDPNESRDIDMADFRHLVDEIHCRTEQSVYAKENCMPSRSDKVDRTSKALETGQIAGDCGVREMATSQHLRFESDAGARSTKEVLQTMPLREENIALLKTVCTLVLYCVAVVILFKSVRYVLPVLMVLVKGFLRAMWWVVRKVAFLLFLKMFLG
jgi:hypothetical protein